MVANWGEKFRELTANDKLFLNTWRWDLKDINDEFVQYIDQLKRSVYDKMKDNNDPWNSKFHIPNSTAKLLERSVLIIKSTEELNYMWTSAVTTSEWETFTCLTEDIKSWELKVSDIYVNKTSISNFIPKGTPISRISDDGSKNRYNKCDNSRELPHYSTSVQFRGEESDYLLLSEEICKLWHLFISETLG